MNCCTKLTSCSAFCSSCSACQSACERTCLRARQNLSEIRTISLALCSASFFRAACVNDESSHTITTARPIRTTTQDTVVHLMLQLFSGGGHIPRFLTQYFRHSIMCIYKSERKKSITAGKTFCGRGSILLTYSSC